MDEEMFSMLLFAEQDGANEEELIKLGYLIRSNDAIFRTNKMDKELREFVDAKKESLYTAIKESGSASDIEKTMEKAGIQRFITFSVVADELVKEGKLIKDKENICIIR
jgi:hypothetical protein